MKSPAFQLYVNDILGSAKFAMMTTEQVGAYMLLLFLDWQEGGFEYAPKRLARWCRLSPAKFATAWTEVGPCFEEIDGRLWSPRLRVEREKQKAWREKAAKGAAVTNEKRWGEHHHSDRSTDRPSDEIATDDASLHGRIPFSIPSSTPVTAKASSAAAAPRADVEMVLAHYTATHPRRRPGEKDRGVVRRALTNGYSVAELCAAIDGNAADPWHREKAKHELTYVLRDNGQIDTFREKVRRPALVGGKPRPSANPTEDADRLHQQQVAVEDRYAAAKKRAGQQWAAEHPEEYARVLAAVEATYHGKSGAIVEQAKATEIAQRTAKAAGFPPFEKWNQSPSHAGAA